MNANGWTDYCPILETWSPVFRKVSYLENRTSVQRLEYIKQRAPQYAEAPLSWTWAVNPFRTAVRFFEQTTSNSSVLSPKRDGGFNRVDGGVTTCLGIVISRQFYWAHIQSDDAFLFASHRTEPAVVARQQILRTTLYEYVSFLHIFRFILLCGLVWYGISVCKLVQCRVPGWPTERGYSLDWSIAWGPRFRGTIKTCQ